MTAQSHRALPHLENRKSELTACASFSGDVCCSIDIIRTKETIICNIFSQNKKYLVLVFDGSDVALGVNHECTLKYFTELVVMHCIEAGPTDAFF